MRYKARENTRTIPKKLIISIIIACVLANIVQLHDIYTDVFIYSFLIYEIASAYTYSFIFSNTDSKILNLLLGTGVIVALVTLNINPLIIPIIDLGLIILSPILKKAQKRRLKREATSENTNPDHEEKFEYKKTQEEPEDIKAEDYIYFSDCNTIEDIRKRYHELIKIYHPDATTGNTKKFQEIQNEYTRIIGEYDNEKSY